MEIQRIESPADYARVLSQIDALMSAEAGTEEGRLLERLAKLVQEYEAGHLIDIDKLAGKENI